MIKRGIPFYLQIHSGFYIIVAIALLIIPLNWLLSWCVAATIHEIAHILIIFSSGHTVERIEIDWNGAKIITNPLGHDEWLCAIGGPLIGGSLILLTPIFPRLGICACVQTIVNMMPIYPLDGGRVIRSVLRRIMPDRLAFLTTRVVGLIFLAILSLALRRILGGFGAIVVVMQSAVELWNTKIPCKPRGKWVQ